MGARIVIGVGVVAALAAGALLVPHLLRQAPPVAETSRAAPGDPPLPVEILTVQPGPLTERLATTGTLRANESVDLVSEISGIAERISLREGAPVRRGALLVKIEDSELQAQRERVQYRLRLAESREARQRDLREQGVVSEQEYDVADNEMNVLRAELRLVEAELAKTEIRAPFDGIVGLRYVSEGSLLTPQTRIATLQDLDPLKLDFTLPEQYGARVRPGTEVEFRVKGSDHTRTAEIYAVEPRISSETRSLIVRARTPNPDHALLPGAFADVSLAVAEIQDAIVVPSLAVIPELGGKKVFVVEDGLAQPRSVESGIRTEDEVQITAGLAPGDRVIVSAIQRLRPGLAVEPAAGKDSAAP
jgi:membrane fusion protein (multidrug efflux system)